MRFTLGALAALIMVYALAAGRTARAEDSGSGLTVSTEAQAASPSPGVESTEVTASYKTMMLFRTPVYVDSSAEPLVSKHHWNMRVAVRALIQSGQCDPDAKAEAAPLDAYFYHACTVRYRDERVLVYSITSHNQPLTLQDNSAAPGYFVAELTKDLENRIVSTSLQHRTLPRKSSYPQMNLNTDETPRWSRVFWVSLPTIEQFKKTLRQRIAADESRSQITYPILERM